MTLGTCKLSLYYILYSPIHQAIVLVLGFFLPNVAIILSFLYAFGQKRKRREGIRAEQINQTMSYRSKRDSYSFRNYAGDITQYSQNHQRNLDIQHERHLISLWDGESSLTEEDGLEPIPKKLSKNIFDSDDMVDSPNNQRYLSKGLLKV